jgi:hypothetical protein
MKNMKILCMLFACLACLPSALWAQSSRQIEADALIAKWLWSISHEYIDGYANCYWPEATIETYDNKGQSSLLTGVKAIRQRQQDWADKMDFSKVDVNYPDPTRFVPANGDIYVYSYVLKQFKEIEIFYLQKKGAELRILRQLDLLYVD